MAAFLLVASSAESLNGKRITSEVMARRRLEAGRWGLYANTPHKHEIKLGDTLIIYLAGKNGMRFFASAEAGLVDFNAKDFCADGDALTDPPVAVISLLSCYIFPSSLPIERIKDRLEFVPKENPRWGCVLQRGVKRISDTDAALILAEAIPKSV